MVIPVGRPLDLSKLMSFVIVALFWLCAGLGIILSGISQNYHFGNRPVVRDMIICGCLCLPHDTEHVDSLLDFVQNSAAKPSLGCIFGI